MQMKDVVMLHMMVFFIIIITWFIYVAWAQHDDFCFYIIFALLSSVLYVLVHYDSRSFEAFQEQGEQQQAMIDYAGFKALAKLKDDSVAVLRPRLENLVASFRGNAKVDAEQKYDDAGNEVDEEKPDEVPVPKDKERDIRSLNQLLLDMRKFDPGYYYGLLGLAKQGKVDSVVMEEYVL